MTAYPSYTRYYLGAIGLGVGVGIAWTQALTSDYAQRFITKPHAMILLYGIVAFLFMAQAWMIVRWDRRLRADRAALEKMWGEMGRIPSPWKDKP